MPSDEKGIGFLVTASEVFPELTSDFETFRAVVSGLSLTDTILWCARLIRAVTDPSGRTHSERQSSVVIPLLTEEQRARINEIARQRRGAERTTVFFRGQLLELLRWVCLLCEDQPVDGQTFEDPEVRRRFVQAALLASDIWGRRVYGNRFSTAEGVAAARVRSLGAMRKGVEGSANRI